MGFNSLQAGSKVPEVINVLIEICSNGSNVKYEIDKNTGMLTVDRFLSTSMRYPCDYGFIPKTLSEDGDPVDVLVLSPVSLMPGVVIPCRPIGMLNMTDDAGKDAKILAVPVNKITHHYDKITEATEVNPNDLARIEHFFKHYKDLEAGKWTEIRGWSSAEAARQEILDSVKRYQNL